MTEATPDGLSHVLVALMKGIIEPPRLSRSWTACPLPRPNSILTSASTVLPLRASRAGADLFRLAS